MPWELNLLVRLQIPTELGRASESAVGLLLLIFEFDFRKVQRNRLCRNHSAFMAAGLIAGDEEVGEGDSKIGLLIRARLPAGQYALLDVLSRGARIGQFRSRLVNLLGEMEVLHAHLARAAATTGVTGAGIRFAPRPGLDVNFALVLRVRALAIDSVNLQEKIYLSHLVVLLLVFIRAVC